MAQDTPLSSTGGNTCSIGWEPESSFASDARISMEAGTVTTSSGACPFALAYEMESPFVSEYVGEEGIFCLGLSSALP